ALSVAPLTSQTGFATPRQFPGLTTAIIDSRHPDARYFGAQARSLGAAQRVIEGDITDLWQHELLALWRAKPAAVAGLTEGPALFLLERLAWDHGLRVVFEAEHIQDAHGNTTHRVVRSASPELAHILAAAGANWPAMLANALIDGGHTPVNDFRPTDAGLADYLGEATKLYSWIIAPRKAA